MFGKPLKGIQVKMLLYTSTEPVVQFDRDFDKLFLCEGYILVHPLSP